MLSPDLRREKAKEIAKGLLARWDRGEATDDKATIAAHPQLQPELAKELRNARLVRSAVVSARRAGPSLEAAAIPVLSDSEIDAPIELATEVLCPESVGDTGAEKEDAGSEAALPIIPNFLLSEQLDAGGQGVVFKGVQEATGRPVAVKILSGGAVANAKQRARFEREAAILAKLQHPHIVNIVDRGRTGTGQLYIVMEFVDGLDLDDWWSQVPTGSEGATEILTVFAKVCRAVEQAHRLGVVHRDLKPSNVRVDKFAEPRVLDFGLARSQCTSDESRAVTQSGQLLGSIPWASPEQAAGDQDSIGPASDVYSVGVMLYEALTGTFPYRVDGPLHEALTNIAAVMPDRPSSVTGSTWQDRRTPAIDAVVLKMLAKSTSDRYATAGLVAADLERLLRFEPPMAVLDMAVRPSQKRKLLTKSTLGSLILILAIAVGVATVVATRNAVHSAGSLQVFDLPRLTNSVGMDFVKVPSGQFWMGSMSREEGREPSERRRSENVDTFYIGVCEVTQSQYRRVMGALPSRQPAFGDSMPVCNVSWNDANEFCSRLGGAESRSYRLPSEVEWEYACRAGTTTPFASPHGVDALGWFVGNGAGRVHPVATKAPNPWGIHDMHGNVAEWCRDVYEPDVTTGKSPARTLKGGSAFVNALQCRSAVRKPRTTVNPGSDVGFRVILVPTPPPIFPSK